MREAWASQDFGARLKSFSFALKFAKALSRKAFIMRQNAASIHFTYLQPFGIIRTQPKWESFSFTN